MWIIGTNAGSLEIVGIRGTKVGPRVLQLNRIAVNSVRDLMIASLAEDFKTIIFEYLAFALH